MDKGTIEYGAWQAVNNCVNVTPRDNVIIITDKETNNIGRAVLAEVSAITNQFKIHTMEDYGERYEDGSSPLKFPNVIKSDLESADVSFYIAQGKKGELPTFRKPMLEAIGANERLRHVHMIGISQQIMEQGMSADYTQIQRLSAQVADVVRDARQIRVTSSAGTDLTVEFNPEYK